MRFFYLPGYPSTAVAASGPRTELGHVHEVFPPLLAPPVTEVSVRSTRPRQAAKHSDVPSS
jgi:hypothetical protein